MNIKIYVDLNYILISDEAIQTSDNQLIVNTEEISSKSLANHIKEFIQQSPKKNLILSCKNVNKVFNLIKKSFVFIEAAGGLIKNKNKWLFIYRLGKWDLPKGKLDEDELPEATAIRECEEECGIKELKLIKKLPPSYHVYKLKDELALKITYWFLMESDYSKKLIPQTEENIEKAEWFSENDVKQKVLKNTYPALKDLLNQVFN